MLNKINTQLERLSADNAKVRLDRDFAPDVGELVEVELKDAYWHLLPEQFLALLKDLPDNAGSEAIRTAIEKKGPQVWHGPAPDSRDTSP